VATTPHASTRPPIEEEADSPRDFLRESFAGYSGKVAFASAAELRDRDFRLIDEALTLISGEYPAGSDLRAYGARASGPETQDVLIRFLMILRYSRHANLRLDALCLLRIMGDEGRSLEEIGIEAGLGPDKKGTVHKRYREIQQMLGGLPGRGDKSPVARGKYRQLRTGKRRARAAWSGAGAWSQPLPSSR
jgi:hypothetical protein